MRNLLVVAAMLLAIGSVNAQDDDRESLWSDPDRLDGVYGRLGDQDVRLRPDPWGGLRGKVGDRNLWLRQDPWNRFRERNSRKNSSPGAKQR